MLPNVTITSCPGLPPPSTSHSRALHASSTLLYCSSICCCCLDCHVQLFGTPWIVAHQAPLSMGFSRQKYWSGLPFPTPGIFLNQGSNPYFLCLLHWQMDSLLLRHLERLIYLIYVYMLSHFSCVRLFVTL